MRLSQLKYVVAIADTGSFRAAARKLRCSQPTLTKSITQLEEDIGFRIFERTRSGVTQTAHGARLLRQTRMVMSELQRLDTTIAHVHGVQTGRIRLGVSPAIELGILPEVVTRFHSDWPGYELVVSGVLYPHGIQELREGVIDILVGPLPHESVSGQLSVKTLIDTSTIVVARAQHPKASAQRLAEIADANWLIHGPADGPSSLFSEAFRGANLIPPPARLHSRSLAFTLAMLQQGDYFCVLSDQLVDHVRAVYGLVQVPITEELPSRTLAIIVRDPILEDDAVAALIRLLRLNAVRMARGFSRDSQRLSQ